MQQSAATVSVRPFVVDETAEHLIWPDNHPSRVCTATEIACNGNESDTSNLELARALVLQNCGQRYHWTAAARPQTFFADAVLIHPWQPGKRATDLPLNFWSPASPR